MRQLALGKLVLELHLNSWAATPARKPSSSAPALPENPDEMAVVRKLADRI
jgi:hypothetical protein